MELVDIIRDVGFPIAVAAFVLVRLNGKMDRLTTAITSLSSTMERYIDHQEQSEKAQEARDEQRTDAGVQRILDALRA